MWKMVLADDENVILNGLKILLDWESLGIEIVGEASNGAELEKEILVKKPDLVISDIKMPQKTGLEVIHNLKDLPKQPKFIFISGYEEFSYAQDALRYGAVGYLLKPVTVEDLTASVKTALAQLEEHRTVRMFQEEKNELQKIFQNINNGKEYTEEELYQRFEKERICLENCLYVGVCFSLITDETLLEQMSYGQRELLRFGVYNRLVEEFERNRLGFLIKKEEDICDMMAVIPIERREDYIQELLVPIAQKVEMDKKVRLCMGIGSLVDRIDQWKLTHKTARFACELYYFEEHPVIDFSKVNREYKVSFDDYNQLLEETFQRIAAREEEGAMESIEKALTAIENIHYGNRYAAVNRVLLFTGTLMERLFVVELVQGDFIQKQNEVQETIRYLGTYRQMREWILNYYRELLGTVLGSGHHKTAAEIVRALAYIREHYMEDLSLRELSEVACVSQNYFSSLFKKETGENYKSYVTKIRMEEAIKLVLKTDLKTYEISEAVGYNNVRRFVDGFKNIYKMSPMEYRKRYRKK